MSFLADWAERDARSEKAGRHAMLLASLVALLVLLPMLRALPGENLRFYVLLCGVLSAAIYFNSSDRKLFIVAMAIGGGSIASLAVAQTTGSAAAQIVFDVLGMALLGFTTLFMLNTLMHTRDVSRDTVLGGVNVYLLIALLFALAYILAIDLGVGALLEQGTPIDRSNPSGAISTATILYFSIVTLTTLGYGDITPTGEVVRSLASGEALIGQLYIAIFIARLIALRRD